MNRCYDLMKGLVSVIIPCYNVKEEYLFMLFDSLKAQKYKDIELIFIDDGSTDGTLELLKEFSIHNKNSFSDIKIIKHEINMGLCTAINSGIKNATGAYLYWCDADDILTEDCILSLVSFLENHKKYQAVIGNAEAFYQNGEHGPYVRTDQPVVGGIFETYFFGLKCRCAGINMVQTEFLLDILPEEGIPEDVTEQNWYLVAITAAYGEIAFLSDIVYRYRIHDGSDSRRRFGNWHVDSLKLWDAVDNINYHILETSKFQVFYKNRLLMLQIIKSSIDRLQDADPKDYDYVNMLISQFYLLSGLNNYVRNRKIYIWGTSRRQKNLFIILNRYTTISGFVDSTTENIEASIICGKNISPDNMYIIIPLDYHFEIANRLQEAGFVEDNDYYYPKKIVYEAVASGDNNISKWMIRNGEKY